MTRSLVWKDFREQQGLAVAIVGLGVASIAVLTGGLIDERLLRDIHFWERTTRTDMARNMALAFAWTGGLIAGAIALAGEREAGTLPFLDALTRLRRPVWRVKCAFGAVLSLAQTAILLAAAWAYGVIGDGSGPWAFGLVFLAATLYSFAWGMLGSAYARTVLGACGLAILGQLAGGAIVAGIASLLQAVLQTQGQAEGVLQAFSLLLVTALPLTWSAARFCRYDAGRRQLAWPAGVSTPVVVQPTPWRSVFWLTWKQAAAWALPAVVATGIAGFFLPHAGLTVWPALTGLLGLAAGVGVFAGEQGTGAARFLGDRRLPAGSVWRNKVGAWFSLAAVPSLIALLIGLVLVSIFDPWASSSTRDDSIRARQLSEILVGGLQNAGDADAAGSGALWSAEAAYLSVWLLYGFAVGQFVALVFRKAVIAGAVALVVVATVLGLWLPSLAAGGLHPWQWLGPPVILLAATRLAVRPWMSGRLGGSRAMAGLTAAALAAAGWQAGALWYRPVEVIGPAEPFDVRSYEASFPKPEQNAAGSGLMRAATHYREREAAWRTEGVFGGSQAGGAAPEGGAAAGAAAAPPGADAPAGAPPPPAAPAEPANPPPSLWERLKAVPSSGWPSGDAELERWLDKKFAAEHRLWVEELRAAVSHPPGALYDVSSLTFMNPTQAVQDCREMAVLLCARALQLQLRGDASGALDHIRLALDVARHLRSKSFPIQFLTALAIEDVAQHTLERWTERLGQHPELLSQALRMLRDHEANAVPFTEALKGEYFIVRNAMQDPSVIALFVDNVPQQNLHDWNVQFRMAARGAAIVAPWESERTSRLLATLFAGYLRAAETPYARLVDQLAPVPETISPRVMSRQDQLLDGWIAPTPELSTNAARSRLADQLAATWWANRLLIRQSGFLGADFRARTNLRAAQLQMALALYEQREGKPAASLDALVPGLLPAVPTDPFGGGPFHYRLPEGEKPGVVWSVGPDLIDQGGHGSVNHATVFGKSGPPGDIIYPVPRSKK